MSTVNIIKAMSSKVSFYSIFRLHDSMEISQKSRISDVVILRSEMSDMKAEMDQIKKENKDMRLCIAKLLKKED